MVTQVLGSHNFLEAPTVNNDGVIVSSESAIPNISSGLFAAMPAAGLAGRLYLATDTNIIYRDDGSTWQQLINGKSPIIKQNVSGIIPALTSTATIPQDNTVPLSTEGAAVWSQSFTPTNGSSRIQIQFACQLDSGTNNRMIAFAIFRNTTCIAVSVQSIASAARPAIVMFQTYDDAPGAGTVTYSCRAGVTGATATWYINSNAAAYYGGQLAKSSYSIQEF